MKIIVVRDDSAFLFSAFGRQPAKPGDVVLFGANVLCSSEPEGHITITTICADADYVLDQVRWLPSPDASLRRLTRQAIKSRVCVQTVIRCTPNRLVIDTTLSPFLQAVRIESSSLSVGVFQFVSLGF